MQLKISYYKIAYKNLRYIHRGQTGLERFSNVKRALLTIFFANSKVSIKDDKFINLNQENVLCFENLESMHNFIDQVLHTFQFMKPKKIFILENNLGILPYDTNLSSALEKLFYLGNFSNSHVEVIETFKKLKRSKSLKPGAPFLLYSKMEVFGFLLEIAEQHNFDVYLILCSEAEYRKLSWSKSYRSTVLICYLEETKNE